MIEATVSTGQGNLLILGVDMLGDRSLRTYDLEGTDEAIDDPLVFLAQADSLIVTKTFAEKNGSDRSTAACPCAPCKAIWCSPCAAS